MNPERWVLIKEIFDSAIELEPAFRERHVREAAAGDQIVVEEVLSLLRADSDKSLSRPTLSTLSQAARVEAGHCAAGPQGSTQSLETQPSPGDDDLPLPVNGFGDTIGSYRLLESIGRGGMGIVYRAYDERLHKYVALKTLQRTSAVTLHRLKQEFRTFAGLDHPNLVSLYELISDGTRWCFTMELVEGRSFLAYVSGHAAPPFCGLGPNSPGALQRLRNAFRQLACGVAALHAAHKLHRDLKPSNVLVTAEHRVVVLDYGLGVALDRIGIHQTTDDQVFGSIAYMSPEQTAGGPLSAASDWYSVGVILFQALTGRLPFEGTLLEILQARGSREPEPPASLVPAIPEDLNVLCRDLLRRNPEDRPAGPEILARLGARFEPATEAAEDSSRHREGLFVGRGRELAALRDAYRAARRGKPVLVYVQGHSGAGKTALVQHFLNEVTRDPEPVVLAGRCHEQESLPFKALDSLIDSLVRYLRLLGSVELNAVIPRDIRALARVFPAFWRLPVVAEAPLVGTSEISPVELRRRAAVALRELLARIGDRHPLVLFIDDLHWGDADSATLLTDILTAADSPVFLAIGCYRSEDEASSPFLSALQEHRRHAPAAHDERYLTLGRLEPEETHELAVRLIEAQGPAAQALVDEIVCESAGRPFLVYELIEHVSASTEGLRPEQPLTLNHVLWRRIEALSEENRTLLEVVAVAGRPIALEQACRAAGLTPNDLVSLPVLKAARLIRSTPAATDQRIEVYHDRVRQSVFERLAPAVSRDHHRRLAKIFAASGKGDPEVMAYHLHQGGLPEEAAEQYSHAALSAAEALAFGHAAVLYRYALDLKAWSVDQQCLLRTRLGDALSNAGRGAEAAREYLAASTHASAAAGLDLQHRAALALLTSGHVDEGLSFLSPVLRSVGTRLARAPWGALCSLLVRRFQLRIRGAGFKPRREEAISPSALRRIDVGWSVVIGLSVIDPIRGADFQTRSLLLALRAGEPFRVARALAVEAGHLASSGAAARARKILIQAERLSAILERPYASGMVELARGTVAYFDERWKDSLQCCRAAAATFREHCTGATWETNTANAFSLWSLAKMGEVAELTRVCPALLKEARERGDLYAVANLSTQIMMLVQLAADDPEGARAELSRVMAQWSQNGYHVQHHDALLAFVPLELYCGNPSAAWKRVQAEWTPFRWSLLSHVQDLRIEMLQLRAYCALAMAAQAKDPSRFVAAAARDAKRLRGEGLTWTFALSQYIEGTVACLEGNRAAARRQLAAAVAAFDRIDALLYAAVTRRRLAAIAPGETAEELQKAAGAWFARQAVKNPERMIEAFAPGFGPVARPSF